MLSKPNASGMSHGMHITVFCTTLPPVASSSVLNSRGRLSTDTACKCRLPPARHCIWRARTSAALPRGVELDVGDALAVHVVLDDGGLLRPQVEQRHQAAGRADRHAQPSVVEPHRRQRLAGLCARSMLWFEQQTQESGRPVGAAANRQPVMFTSTVHQRHNVRSEAMEQYITGTRVHWHASDGSSTLLIASCKWCTVLTAVCPNCEGPAAAPLPP